MNPFRTNLFRTSLCRLLVVGAVLCAAPTFAQSDTSASLPAWEQLSAADREALIAPIRERWNANPEQRARLMHHARSWQSLSPDQRRDARHGMRRWAHMDPAKRAQVRALYGQMRNMTPEQRKALREQWHEMTPEQRREWLRQHAPQSTIP